MLTIYKEPWEIALEKEYAPWMATLGETMGEEQAQLLQNALHYAMIAHQGQTRKTGEPYISHPCAVAKILLDFGMDAESMAAALLHDVVEDTPATKEEMQVIFGPSIAELVDGVTKLSKLDFESKMDRQAESLRKMLLAMSRDVRVILVKLADRLHNMRTLHAMPEDRQKAIAKETLEIYAPIAHRLGIYAIRGELEDLALRYLEPEQYDYICRETAKLRPVQSNFLHDQMDRIQKQLADVGIECKMEGREKHVYSIYRKMIKQGRKPDEIYDFMAMRIIVETVRDCYAALGIVHTLYKPIPGRFKDFIAMPKSNMYQSLHTTVITRAGILFEVQIRTIEMHKTAEYGVAAHWKYKEGKEDDSFDEKIAWMRELQAVQSDVQDPHEFLETVRMDIFSDEVFVFTPKGEVINLVRGATPIDFAYRIHSRVGETCVGARISGRMVPLDTELKTGDVVEIITRKDGHPGRDWLKIAKTSAARSRIRAYFKRELKEENIVKGRDMLEKEAKRAGYDLYKQLMRPEWLEGIYKKYTFHNAEDMYSAIGFGGISTNQILQRLIEQYTRSHQEEKLQALLENQKKEEAIAAAANENKKQLKASNGIIVKGEENMLVRLARCCNPVPGDNIVGFITRGRGVSVHRADCANLKDLLNDGEDRWIEVHWANENAQEKKKEGYKATVRIVCMDRTGMMAELSRILSNMGVDVVGVQGKQGKNGSFHFEFDISIRDIAQLEEIITKFRRVRDVIEVYRGTL